MKREEIESVLKEIHCKGFVFVLEPLIVDIKSVAMKCINNLPLETRESIYELLTADKCYYKLEVIVLGYDAGIDRPNIKFDKYWLITPEMDRENIIKMVFEAVLSVSKIMIEEKFKVNGLALFDFKNRINNPFYFTTIPNDLAKEKLISHLNKMVNHDLSVIPSEKAELLFCGNTEFPPDHITFKAPRFTAIPIDDTIANRFPEFSIKEKIVKSLNADIPNLVKEDGILVQKKEAVNV